MGKFKELLYEVAEDVISNYLDVEYLDSMDPETKEDAVYGVLDEYIEEVEDEIISNFLRENIDTLASFIIMLLDEDESNVS